MVHEEIRIACYCLVCGNFCRSFAEDKIDKNPKVYCSHCKEWCEDPVTKSENFKIVEK